MLICRNVILFGGWVVFAALLNLLILNNFSLSFSFCPFLVLQTQLSSLQMEVVLFLWRKKSFFSLLCAAFLWYVEEKRHGEPRLSMPREGHAQRVHFVLLRVTCRAAGAVPPLLPCRQFCCEWAQGHWSVSVLTVDSYTLWWLYSKFWEACIP